MPGLGFTIGGAVSRKGDGTGRYTPAKTPTLSNAQPTAGAVTRKKVGYEAVTSSAYGEAIPLGFGTMRMAGNIIWSQPIKVKTKYKVEEPGGTTNDRDGVSSPTYSSGTGSGTIAAPQSKVLADNPIGGTSGGTTSTAKAISGSVITKTVESVSKYGTFAVAFGVGPAADLLRLWADGKLFFDKTGNKTEIEVGKLKYRFYEGSETQEVDAVIEASEAAGEAPAYRGLCYIVFENFPLENFDGKIPNIQAEIVFERSDTRPVIFSTPLSGGLTSATSGKIAVDWNRGYIYYGQSGLSGGIRRVNLFAGIEDYQIPSSIAITSSPQQLTQSLAPAMGVDGAGALIVAAGALQNSVPLVRLDPNNLVETHRFGTAGSGTSNSTTGFVNMNRFASLPILTADGLRQNYMLFGETNGLQAGILRTDDMSFVWHQGLVNGQTFLGDRIKSVVSGAKSEGFAEAWVLTGPRYNVTSTGSLYLYRIQVFTDAQYDAPNSRIEGVAFAHEATFLYTDLIPGVPTLSDAGGLVYDAFDDSLIFWGVNGGTNERAAIKYRPAEGGILWRTANLNTLWQSTPSGFFRLEGSKLGWVTSGGEVGIIDTTSGAILDNNDGASFADTWNGGGFYDSRSHTYIAMADDVSDLEEPMIRFLFDRGTQTSATLSSIITTVGGLVGLDAGDIDVSDVTGISVPGYVIDDQTTARDVIDTVSNLFLVDPVETEFKIQWNQRGNASIRTIPEDDLAMLDNNGATFSPEIIQEVELPIQYNITYLQSDNDYLQQTHFARRIGGPVAAVNSDEEAGIDLPIALTATVAKQRAEKSLFSAWVERNSYPMILSWEHIDLDPTDVVTISLNNGNTYRCRLSEWEVGQDFSIEGVAIGEEGNYTATVLGDGGSGLIQQVVVSIAAVKSFILDIPYIHVSYAVPDRTENVALGLSGGYADNQFVSGLMQKRVGTLWETVGSTYNGTLWGVVTNPLDDKTGNEAMEDDTTSVLTVRMVSGGSALLSVTDVEFEENVGINRAAIVKANGEIEVIRFKTVTANADGSHSLTYIRRGYRGTETMASGNAVGDTFVLISRNLGFNIRSPLIELDTAVEYRGVGDAQELYEGELFSHTSEHRSLMPLAPVELTATEDVSNNIDFAWTRRDRLGVDLVDGTGDQPMSESTEQYEIDILDGPGGSIVQSATGLTTPAYEYPNADIITDFGSVPTSITAIVYQISAEVGRGFGQEVTVDVQ